MYKVNFFQNRQLVNTFEFGTEIKAIDCLLRHASEKQLTISNDNSYASSDGNMPELEIQIEQYEY